MDSWKVLKVERNSVDLQSVECVSLQLKCVCRIELRSLYLNRDINGGNIFFSEKTRMSSNNTVDQVVSFRSQAEDSPASVAVAHGADFAVLGAKLLGASKDLWLTLLSAVSSQKALEVNLPEGFSFESVK